MAAVYDFKNILEFVFLKMFLASVDESLLLDQITLIFFGENGAPIDGVIFVSALNTVST